MGSVMPKPDLFFRSKERTDEKYGKTPKDRSIPELIDLGIVIIDKPVGPSSHQVTGWVKQILKIKKAGHLGTLDPNVSGVLPILLGRATLAASSLMEHDKEYVGIMHFKKPIEGKQIKDVFKKFTGTIEQIPPVGAAVVRKKRKKRIHSLESIEISANGRDVLFKVSCEAGTYIRTLCEDIGKAVSNPAKMTDLRRTRVGKWNEKDAVSLYDLSDAFWLWEEKGKEARIRKIIHPIESAIEQKKVWISDRSVEAICSGAQLMAPGIVKVETDIGKEKNVAIFTLKDELVAFGTSKMDSNGMITATKGNAVKINRVIMKRGTYPKGW